MWSHAGSIITNAARVYYLPDSESLPPLGWKADVQRFVYLNAEDNGEDAMIRATLVNLASTAASPSVSGPLSSFPGSKTPLRPPGDGFISLDAMSNSIACECLYGVVPVGAAASVLLYVTKRAHVTTLTLPGLDTSDLTGTRVDACRHEVYAVRKLEWLQLPSRVSPSRSCVPTPVLRAADRRESEGNGWPSTSASAGDGGYGGSDDDEEGGERVPEEVLRGYLETINHFCEQVSSHGGEHAYLYYSPTINLALHPEEILRGQLRLESVSSAENGADGGSEPGAAWQEASLGAVLPETPPQSNTRLRGRPAAAAAKGADDERSLLSSQRVFQWNHMLLRAFVLPQNETDLENTLSLAASTRMGRLRTGSAVDTASTNASLGGSSASTSSGGAPASAVEMNSSLCAGSDHPWCCVSMLGEHRGELFDAAPLYIPRFIRGLVAAYDVTQDAPSVVPTVQLHLITRLSCRWAGTRYNRRGLEPGGSGVPANCAITSIWVGTRPAAAAAMAPRHDKEKPSAQPRHRSDRRMRMAVLSLLRGSIPRRWEQPADFHFKPPLKVSSPSSGSEELLSHLRFLHRLFPDLAKVACIDTTSTSALEAPLSDAFSTAVTRVQRDIVRSLPFEPLSEDDDGAPRDSAATTTVAARNAKTPVSYLKYNMKERLRALAYGALRRDLLANLEAQHMGFCSSAHETSVRRRAGPTTSRCALLPSWLDYTECGYTARSNAPIAESESSGSARRESSPGAESRWLRPQRLYYRVNCLDCLDRTNLTQSLLGESALPYMLDSVLDRDDGSTSNSQESGMRSANREKLCIAASTALRRLMAQQGVAISQLYASSDAHFLSLLLDADTHGRDDNNENSRYRASLEEAIVALKRWFFQNMRDGRKQDGVSLVTLQHDPAHYPSDIESPFSRDLSSMNALVLYGVLFAIIPFVFSVVSVLFLTVSGTERNVHMALCVGWVVYFVILAQKLPRYRVTYANQPLLNYTTS